MAWYGYVDVPHSTYEEWKQNTINNGYDVDGYWGCQCWDFASLFWRNVGYAAGYPLTGPNHSAYECWTVSREANQGSEFDLIYNKEEIKIGDVIVFGGGANGHIAFANEDYGGTDSMECLGQNQGGGTPGPGGGTSVSLNILNLSGFLGAFRYKGWESTPPQPPLPSLTTNNHFPWVLIARKLRNRNNVI